MSYERLQAVRQRRRELDANRRSFLDRLDLEVELRLRVSECNRQLGVATRPNNGATQRRLQKAVADSPQPCPIGNTRPREKQLQLPPIRGRSTSSGRVYVPMHHTVPWPRMK